MDFRERNHTHHYIGGQWIPQDGESCTVVRDPFRGSVVGKVPGGTSQEISSAVESACRAGEAWRCIPPIDRARYLSALGRGLKQRLPILSDLITREVGTPIRASRRAQVGLPIQVLDFYARLAHDYSFDRRAANSVICSEPVGVVGCITPWNLPLLQTVSKVAPALAAGCTVVVKPSELAPLSAFELADIADEVGLPAGVLNVVSGNGSDAGQALVSHPDVDKVSFTGSTKTGRHVMAIAAQSIKKLTLELGGKSACIMLDDADPGAVARAVVRSCMFNAGQSCIAWSRLVVPQRMQALLVDLVAAEVRRYVAGDPLDESTMLGPLISEAQRQQVRDYIEQGIRDGARLVAGGLNPPVGLQDEFVQVTVFCDVDPELTIAQEEIFGPVLCIIPYRDEDQAVEIGNGTVYGLHGSVWSAEQDRATAVARRLQAGQIAVNCMRFDPSLPLGGWKQSGVGREFGEQGLREYLQEKVILY